MQSFLPIGDCPIRNVLSRLGDKWSMLVVVTLHSNGVMRFSDIHKTIGDISHRMLTVTLKSMEADGLIARKVYPQIPPKVEYTLTERGNSLIPHLEGLVGWATEHIDEIMHTRSQVKADY